MPTTMSHKEKYVALPANYKLSESKKDIICGHKSSTYGKWPASVYYRNAAQALFDEYEATPITNRKSVALKLYKALSKKGYRFLSVESEGNIWKFTEAASILKIQQTFRDMRSRGTPAPAAAPTPSPKDNKKSKSKTSKKKASPSPSTTSASKSKTTKKKKTPFAINPQKDIVGGRKSSANSQNPGNVYFREQANAYFDQYERIDITRKKEVAVKLFKSLQSKGYRFVSVDSEKDRHVLSEEQSIVKIQQTFRDIRGRGPIESPPKSSGAASKKASPPKSSSSKKAKSKKQSLFLHDDDIICGMGNPYPHRPAHLRFNNVLHEFESEYRASHNQTKMDMIRHIIEVIRHNGSRFVEIPGGYQKNINSKTAIALVPEDRIIKKVRNFYTRLDRDTTSASASDSGSQDMDPSLLRETDVICGHQNPAKRAANQRFVELMNEHAPMYQATDDSNKQDFLRNLLYNRIQARFVELVTPATDETPRVVVVDEEKIMKKMQSFIHRHHPGSNSVRSTTIIQPSPSSAAASLSFDMDSKEHFTDRHVQDKFDLRPLDIVCGKRAGTFHLREANQYYMWLAYDKLKDYDAAGDSKRDFSSKIVLELFQQGYRFMATFGKDDGFYEMTYTRSVEKLQQSFRDMRLRSTAPPKVLPPHLKWSSGQEKEKQKIMEPPNNGGGGPKKKPRTTSTATAKQPSSTTKKNKGMKSITSLAQQPDSSKPKRKASSLALYCHLEEEDVILGYGLKRKYAKRSSQLEFEGLLKQYVNRFELSSGLHQTILCREIANVTDERGGRFLRENKYRKFLQVPYDNAVEVIRQLLLDLAEDEEEMEHLEELDIQESDIIVGQNLSKGFQERSSFIYFTQLLEEHVPRYANRPVRVQQELCRELAHRIHAEGMRLVRLDSVQSKGSEIVSLDEEVRWISRYLMEQQWKLQEEDGIDEEGVPSPKPPKRLKATMENNMTEPSETIDVAIEGFSPKDIACGHTAARYRSTRKANIHFVETVQQFYPAYELAESKKAQGAIVYAVLTGQGYKFRSVETLEELPKDTAILKICDTFRHLRARVKEGTFVAPLKSSKEDVSNDVASKSIMSDFFSSLAKARNTNVTSDTACVAAPTIIPALSIFDLLDDSITSVPARSNDASHDVVEKPPLHPWNEGPYTLEKSVESGEPMFIKVKSLLQGKTLVKQQVLATLCHGQDMARNLIAAYDACSSEPGEVPKTLLPLDAAQYLENIPLRFRILCLQEDALGRMAPRINDNPDLSKRALSVVVGTLCPMISIQEALKKWNLESRFPNIAAVAVDSYVKYHVHDTKKFRQCLLAEIFVARVAVSQYLLGLPSIEETLMWKCKFYLDILNKNIFLTPASIRLLNNKSKKRKAKTTDTTLPEKSLMTEKYAKQKQTEHAVDQRWKALSEELEGKQKMGSVKNGLPNQTKSAGPQIQGVSSTVPTPEDEGATSVDPQANVSVGQVSGSSATSNQVAGQFDDADDDLAFHPAKQKQMAAPRKLFER